MKTIKSKSTLTLISITTAFLLFMFISPSNSFAQVKGKGEITKKERKVSNFQGVSVATGIDLYLTQSNSESVFLETYENLHDLIKIEVQGGILKIHSTKRGYNTTKAPKVYVSIKTLNKLKGSSGSDIYGQNNFKVDNLEIDMNSGSDLKIEVTANTIDCDINSGSDAEISGTTNFLKVNASSGSDLEAFNLVSKTCNVDASSAADVNINVTEKLTADASSGSDINYKGNPEYTNLDESSGADINKR